MVTMALSGFAARALAAAETASIAIAHAVSPFMSPVENSSGSVTDFVGDWCHGLGMPHQVLPALRLTREKSWTRIHSDRALQDP
ncbi:MAG: hypothetical protein ACREPY_18370, partial [Rhodanobacteraceae bacterium]